MIICKFKSMWNLAVIMKITIKYFNFLTTLIFTVNFVIIVLKLFGLILVWVKVFCLLIRVFYTIEILRKLDCLEMGIAVGQYNKTNYMIGYFIKA